MGKTLILLALTGVVLLLLGARACGARPERPPRE